MLVNIDVDDLEKAIDFYERGLGLSLSRRLFDSTVAEMSGATSRIFLIQQPAGSNATKASGSRRNYARHWTPVHIDFEVEDVVVARDRAIAAGAKTEGDISTAKWGRLARMSDPFGHGFCLIEFSEEGYGG
ncbi:MAG: VOC family protein [Proteobacteria bacterium]|nr:VOC family protein [Pseudomonadota bacterium]